MDSLMFTVSDLKEIIAISSSIGLILWALIEWRGSRVFVSRQQFDELKSDVETLRGHLMDIPKSEDIHEEMNQVKSELMNVHTHVSEVGAALDGLTSRVEALLHQFNILLEHELNKE
jgi:hypothetical protein